MLLADVLQLSCCLLLALIWTRNCPGLYFFQLFLWSVMLSVLIAYQYDINHLWQGWRAWVIVLVEVGVSTEASFLLTTHRKRHSRTHLRYQLSCMALAIVGVLIYAHPEPYPGTDKMSYLIHLCSTVYAMVSVALVLALNWRDRAIRGAYDHAAGLLFWFLANAVTSTRQADRNPELFDSIKIGIHITCIAWWAISIQASYRRRVTG